MKRNEVVKLIALSRGKSKTTGKSWYRGTMKGHAPDGTPIVAEFWIDETVGDECVRLGLIEDVYVRIEAGLDDFLRLTITKISPADNSLDSSVEIDLN